jgi:REP element-mobilizing transposase RayT
VSRKPREELEGGLYHVFARGNAKQLIFLDDCDRRTYLLLLGREIERRNWKCLAYCLMENHVHLVLETPDANLGRGMQRLHSAYAQFFNERHERVGHLFQGRYGAVRIETDEQLWTALAYLAANPVKANLCDRAVDWQWSSCGHVLKGESAGLIDLGRIAWYLSGFNAEPLDAYASLVKGSSDPLSGGDSRGLTPIGSRDARGPDP